MQDENLEKKYKKIKAAIENSKRVLLAGHADPDGDSLGSTLGMGRAISQNTDAEVMLYSVDGVPEYLKFLPHSSYITNKINKEPDLVIGFDYGDFHRLGLPEQKIKNAKIITFDHHPRSGQVGEVQIIETEFSSTCEIVYGFIRYAEWDIDKDIALSLLTGIVTDTGGLSYNTFQSTFKAVGGLMEKGISMEDVYNKTFANKPKHVLKVCEEFMQNMVFDEDSNIAAVFVPFEEFKECGISYEDLKNGLLSSLLSMKETEFIILMIEQESGKIKGSLRSNDSNDIDASKIAQQLGGGGHKNASAFVIEGEFEHVKDQVLDVVNNNIVTR